MDDNYVAEGEERDTWTRTKRPGGTHGGETYGGGAEGQMGENQRRRCDARAPQDAKNTQLCWVIKKGAEVG
jgi:hypothetical protein